MDYATFYSKNSHIHMSRLSLTTLKKDIPYIPGQSELLCFIHEQASVANLVVSAWHCLHGQIDISLALWFNTMHAFVMSYLLQIACCTSHPICFCTLEYTYVTSTYENIHNM